MSINYLRTAVRHYSSALYITGNKASTNFSLLTPHIDFEERIKNKVEIVENIKLRQLNLNLDKILKDWQFYKHLMEELTVLDLTREAIHTELTQLMKKTDKSEEEINVLKNEAKTIKNYYTTLRDYIYPVEETAALEALSLPNILDERTPATDETLIHSYNECPKAKSNHHLEIATQKNLIHYVNPYFVFLKNEAAEIEFELVEDLRVLLSKGGFAQFVNPSFVRSAIAEGCCDDIMRENTVFTVSEEDVSKFSVNKLHFVGGASLYPFMAYFARFSIQGGYFPLKLFSCGRQYKPITEDTRSLFNLSQNTVVQVFMATQDDYSKEFDDIIAIVKDFYDSLGFHYRMVYLPANKLELYDSLRISIQMFSLHQQKYIEVGNISLSNSFLSKRLLVTYKPDKDIQFANIISGSLLNVQALLGCVFEYNNSLTLEDVEKKRLI